jgi:hypothetical protein
MSSKSTINVGPGLATGLTLLFAAGKIFGYLDWSWWWVLSPVWISLLVVLGIFAIVFLIAVLVAALK